MIFNHRVVPNMTGDDNSSAADHHLSMVQIVLGKPIKIWCLCRLRARKGADHAEKKIGHVEIELSIFSLSQKSAEALYVIIILGRLVIKSEKNKPFL